MEEGFLLGHSNAFSLDAMVTYSDENGIQVWYKGEGDCGACDEYASCKAALMREADVRSIELPKEVEALEPSRLADILFDELTGEIA